LGFGRWSGCLPAFGFFKKSLSEAQRQRGSRVRQKNSIERRYGASSGVTAYAASADHR
jgi:hypothetical protein